MAQERKAGVARRNVLRTLGGAAGVLAARPLFTIAAESAKGANDRVGVGFIGVGGRAGAHMHIVHALSTQGRAQPVAVCDVYAPRARAASERMARSTIYRDHRELLQNPDVDVVCIATPDRHHAPQALDAVRAGKDVYCEKPLTHWIQFPLARQLAQETAKHKRIVQVGTQYMAGNAHAQAAKLVKEGVIGKVVHVQAGFFRRGDWGERMRIPKGGAKAKPGPELDWERFLGDAPKVPFSVSRFFQWRLYWDYAGGPSTDLLVHTFTPVHRVLELGYPDRVFGGGGMFQYGGAREVPDQCNMIVDYPGGPSVVLTNSLSNATSMRYPNGGHVVYDTIIRGTNGIITFEKQGIVILPHGAKKPTHTLAWNGMGNTTLLWTDLLECVKSRKQPLSPVSIAAKVQAPLNMAILSHREGKVARFDAEKEAIVL